MPAGAIPKDGPSAGITMATAIASLITGRPVRSDTAMTGEITLTGQVLPIGGLKEKALAAQRAEIGRVIIPRRNEPDVDDVPPNLREKMEFLPVDHVDQVLEAALEPPAGARPATTRSTPARRRRSREPIAARLRPVLRGSVSAGSGRVQCPHRKRISRREMAAKKKAAKAGAGAVAAGHAVQSNPYVQRLIEDRGAA